MPQTKAEIARAYRDRKKEITDKALERLRKRQLRKSGLESDEPNVGEMCERQYAVNQIIKTFANKHIGANILLYCGFESYFCDTCRDRIYFDKKAPLVLCSNRIIVSKIYKPKSGCNPTLRLGSFIESTVGGLHPANKPYIDTSYDVYCDEVCAENRWYL